MKKRYMKRAIHSLRIEFFRKTAINLAQIPMDAESERDLLDMWRRHILGV